MSDLVRTSPPGGVPAEAAPPSWGLPAPSPVDEGGGGLDWRRMLTAIFRYKWLVLGVVVLGGAASVVFTRFVPPTYVAQATVWVPVRGREGEERRPDQIFTALGWIELIKTSFVVLDDVVRDLRLYLDVGTPEDSLPFSTFGLGKAYPRPGDYQLVIAANGKGFELRGVDGRVWQRGAVGDSIGTELGFRWVPPEGTLRPGKTIPFSVTPPRDVALGLQQTVSVGLNPNGANFLALRLNGTDPARITATVNKIATGFVDTARSLSSSKQREKVRMLRQQLDSAEAKLVAADIALEAFRVRTITMPGERGIPVAPGVSTTTNPALDRYMTMKIELDGVKEDRAAIEKTLAAVGDSGVDGNAFLFIGAAQKSAELSAALKDLTDRQSTLSGLRLQYTDEYPEVQRAVGDIAKLKRQTIPAIARGLLAQLDVRARELQDRIGAAGVQLEEIPRRSTEEQRLTREVAIAAAARQSLKQQYQDALLAESSEDIGAKVFDPAVVPRRPIRDAKLRLIAMGFMGSLGLGIVGAVLLDRVDRRVRYPDQVSRELGLQILGAIPRVKNGTNGRALRSSNTAEIVEALRGVRLGLVHAHGAAGPVVVTITSPGPAEGKSFVASNLALAFADAGQRTILVDGDVRRGELHRVLGTSRKPGLTDFLQGKVGQPEVVQRTRYNLLDFVGGGTRSHSAPELLSSQAMPRLILSLRSSYDVILVDSPPLGAGVDPYVLGTATGNLLLVMRTGVTDRELAEAKLDMLDRLPVRVLGAVLNDINASGQYRYYGYQHYYYVPGYETRDEEGDHQRELPGAAAT